MAVFVDPTDLTSVTLKAWYDAAQERLADGQLVGTVTDRSGNGLNLTQGTGSQQPALRRTFSRRGRRMAYYDFDGTDDYVTAASAADWAFLYDGYAGAMIVCELDAHSVDGRSTILDTGGLSATEKGVWWACDNRGSPNGGPDGLNCRATRAASPADMYQILTGQDTFPPGQRHLIRLYTYDDGGTNTAAVLVDGFAGCNDSDATMTFGTGSPTAALRLGARNNATTLPFNGRIFEVILYDGEITATDRDNLYLYLARKWDLGIWNKPYGGETGVTVSATTSYDAFPTIAEADGDLVCIYRQGTDHTSTFGNLRLRRSADGGASWGSAATIFTGTTENADLRDPGAMQMANGDLLLTWSIRGVGGVGTSVPDGCRWATSSDKGVTWSASSTLNDAFTGFSRCSCRPLQLPNGDLLWAIYGNNHVSGDADNTRWCKVYKSTNSGASWSYLSDIGAVGDAKGWGEPNILRAQNGQLIALVRDTVGADLYRATSNDEGATWSSLALVQPDANSSPQGCVTREGKLVAGQRFAAASDLGYLLTSDDTGATWNRGVRLHATDAPNEYVSCLTVADRVYVVCAKEASSTDSDIIGYVFNEIDVAPARVDLPPPRRGIRR